MISDYFFVTRRGSAGGGGGGGGSHTGEEGDLYIDGLAIKRQKDGSLFPFRGADAFSLFHRHMVGQDIMPVLLELVEIGFNVIRVFSMYDENGIGKANGLGRLSPKQPDYNYNRWHQFLDLCASVGMRVEVVLGADTQTLGFNTDAMLDHVGRMMGLLEPHWNANFVETCNEPAKNGVDLDRVVPRKGRILRASGNYDLENGRIAHVLDYVTLHTERKPEWPRTCRALSEFRDGADGLEAVRVPVVSDEPTGYAEVARPDSRSGPGYPHGDWLDDARTYAAGCQMFGAGSTFHSDSGVSSVLLGPNQRLAAIEWVKAATWMPVDAQFSEYQRGGAGGGAGIGNMPIDHHDLEESTEPRALRTYCKRGAGRENCVAIRRGGGWFVKLLRGCTLIKEAFRGLVEVKEP